VERSKKPWQLGPEGRKSGGKKGTFTSGKRHKVECSKKVEKKFDDWMAILIV
jgi:hypothetical protein